jgi:hypothetical protein
MNAEARQLVEDIDRSLGPLHHHCVEWRRKVIDEDGLMLAALCGCVDDLVETLRLRIPPSLHPAAQENIFGWCSDIRAACGNYREVLRLSKMICECVIQELKWEAESAASAFDFQHAYRLRCQAERFEATHAVITGQIEQAKTLIQRTVLDQLDAARRSLDAFTFRGRQYPSRTLRKGILDTELAFAVGDYVRFERLTQIVFYLAKLETPKFAADPKKWIEKRALENELIVGSSHNSKVCA